MISRTSTISFARQFGKLQIFSLPDSPFLLCYRSSLEAMNICYRQNSRKMAATYQEKRFSQFPRLLPHLVMFCRVSDSSHSARPRSSYTAQSRSSQNEEIKSVNRWRYGWRVLTEIGQENMLPSLFMQNNNKFNSTFRKQFRQTSSSEFRLVLTSFPPSFLQTPSVEALLRIWTLYLKIGTVNTNLGSFGSIQ